MNAVDELRGIAHRALDYIATLDGEPMCVCGDELSAHCLPGAAEPGGCDYCGCQSFREAVPGR